MSITVNILGKEIPPQLHHWLMATMPDGLQLHITATGRAQLTAHQLDQYDQLWLFGDSLTVAEQAALLTFYERGGGVYLASGRNRPIHHNRPQPIPHLQQYYDWSYPGHQFTPVPHPILQTAGQPLELNDYIDDTTDLAAVYQHIFRAITVRPAVQAWLHAGLRRRPMVLTHNGHQHQHGRIIADVVQPSTQLIGYYHNISHWLLPQTKQRQLRNQTLDQLSQQWLLKNYDFTKLPPYLLGAIGRHLNPSPFLTHWLIDAIPHAQRERLTQYGLLTPTHRPLVELSSPIEELILGEILWSLYHHPTPNQLDDETINQLISLAVIEALRIFEPQVQRLQRWLDENCQTSHSPTHKAADEPPFNISPQPHLHNQITAV